MQMAALARAELYFAAGVPFERAWITRFKAQNRHLVIIDVNKGLRLYEMEKKHHEGGPGRNLDPHTWLSPPCALVIARNIYAALVSACPQHRKEFTRRYGELVRRIAILDAKLMEILAPVASKSPYLLTFHPAWGYFARAYGLEQIPVEMEGKEPSPRELDHLASEVKRLGIGYILVQPQFSQRSARALGSICNLKVVTADPLSSNWEDNLLAIARAIVQAALAGPKK
jgi:zinc transport system substrate-binding protein